MAPKKTKTVKLFEVKVEVDNSAHNTYPSMSLITPEIGSSAARSRRSGHVRRIENYVQNYEEFSIARDVNTSMRLSGPGSAITHENKGDFMEKRAKKMKFTDQESAKDDTDMSLGIIAWKPSVSRFADESPYFLKISDNEDFKISDQGPTKEDMVESHLEKIIVVSEKHLYRKTQPEFQMTGNSQGASHFGGVGSPPLSSYPLHHQPSHPISPQPPQVLTPHHSHFHHAPANPQQQAYAIRLAKERQQCSLQQQQQQFATSNSLMPQPQLPISSPLQSSPPATSPPVSLSPPMQKQQTPTQGVVRNTQSGGSGLRNQTGKQRQRQQQFSQANRQQHSQQTQQVQAKGAKGVGRGNMMIKQNVPNDSSLLNEVSTNPGNNYQDKTEPATHLIPNQGLYTAAQPTRQNIGRQSFPSLAVAGPNHQQAPPQQKLVNQNQPALAKANCQINSDPSTKPQIRDSDTDQHPTSSSTEMDTIATFPQASNNASNAGPVVSQASGHQWTPSEQLLDSNALNSAVPNSSESMPQASQGLGQRPSSASLPSSRHDVSAQWQQNQHSQRQEQPLALSVPQLPGLLNSSVRNGRYMASSSAPLSVEEQQRMQHYNQTLSRGSGVDMVSGVNRSLPLAGPGFQGIASSPMVNSRSQGMSSANMHSGLDAGQGSSVLMRPDFQIPGNSQGASGQRFQQQPLQFSTSNSLTPQPQLPISSPMQNSPQSTSLPVSLSPSNQQKPTQGVVRNAQASGSGLTTNQTGKQRKRKQSKQQSSPNKQQDPAKTGQPQYIPQYWDSIRKRFVRVQR